MQNNNTLPKVKLDRGIHVMHLFYGVDRLKWSELPDGASAQSLRELKELCAKHSAPCHPRMMTYAGLGGKADMAFVLFAEDAMKLGAMHRALESCFSPGVLNRIYSYLSVTELSEYGSTAEDSKRMIEHHEKLQPGTAEYEVRLEEMTKKRAEYEHYRLYPELPDWEVMGFYPMTKKRQGADNWYSLDFDTRKKLMGGHAKTGRKYAGRVSQLITGSTGLDDWEWGVTLMAHQLDAIKEIVYEMRFDEVSAKYGEFGPFFINLRVAPDALWTHLEL